MRCTASRKDRLQTAAMAAGSYRSNRASEREESSGRDVYLFLLEEPCGQTGAPKHRRQRYVMLLQPLCPKIGYLELIAHDLSEAMSMTNRYRTSCFSSRSHASLIFCIGMSSMSDTIPCAAQKSSISCVSAIPPMAEPAKFRRGSSRLNAVTGRGCSGAPTSVSVPSSLNRLR